ncbi:MAG: hypothetical protein IT236_18635 [Bacteroidia bacterium]|nr:hypothetical protein [Bacteroidia bacterium]
MKKLFLIFLVLFGIGFAQTSYAQSGGKKREKRIKTRKRGNSILTQYKSRGHADDFARNATGRRGRFAKLFHREKPSWQYKSSGSKRSHNRDNRFLFKRERADGHKENAEYQNRQSTDRTKRRDRGNKSFKRKKFGRK